MDVTDRAAARDGGTAAGSVRPDNTGPVTVVVSRVIRPGAAGAFEEWLEGVCREASRFDGHQGVTILRPAASSRPEYVLIFRFDTYEHLRAWNESPVRDTWLERVKPLTLEPPKAQELTGLEHWFTLPAHETATPPRYKMALLTWIVIFPSVMILRGILQPLIGGFGPLPQTLVMTAILVTTMTWVIMPRVTRWCARWLFASRA